MKKLAHWHYQRTGLTAWLPYLLWPISLIYGWVIRLRRWCYQRNIFQSFEVPVPVIVVGNITLGGTGKTPLVIYLVEYYKAQGMKPVVISRGYGSTMKQFPHLIMQSDKAAAVGDEPVLIHQRTKVPVIIDPKRVRAARYALKHFACDVIISDDGLQHYALRRDVEIAVIDAQRQLGNGLLFPAGPLREPKTRLHEVDQVIYNGVSKHFFGHPCEYVMQLKPQCFVHLQTGQQMPLDYFAEQWVTAMAGIGHPQRFFQTLKELGINVIEQPKADHYAYSVKDFDGLSGPIIVTEKDAVKCMLFTQQDLWYLKVSADIDDFTI